MTKPHILIISPALVAANNGNWHTAWRWSRMLRPLYRTTIAKEWDGSPADAMLALHARRSASAVQTWAQAKGPDQLALVLTGTDLYRDIQTDTSAQRSLQLAGRLVVLQERGADVLPDPLQHKTTVIFQSAPRRATLTKTGHHLRAVMVGHLRNEKDPLTYLRAASRLSARPDILLDHIGDALDPALGQAVQKTAATHPTYRWLGGLPRSKTRAHIQRAHVLVHPSVMEGGAHVILEAVQSGTPVLASAIDGNVGMLGPNYAGYFPLGDDQALADLLQRCRDDADFLALLRRQCDARAPLFAPEREQTLLRQLVANLLSARTRHASKE